MRKSVFLFSVMAAVLSACSDSKETVLTRSGLDPDDFIASVDGKTTGLYTLTNANGLEACITNYGGRVVSLMVPDKNGTSQDVVLGHDSIADYINIDGNFGALIGRYGNRINKGRFSLDGTEYNLPQNNFGHCLHGGEKGFHHSVWDVAQVSDSSITLHLLSPDGYAGFPANVDVDVTYTLSDDNALRISYKATADKPTILNLTNHSYFNLSGDPSHDILSENLFIAASSFTPIDSTFMTTGEICPVEGTPFDFRTSKAIGADIDSDCRQLANGLGYDHNFVLDEPDNISAVAARLSDPVTGIVMEVFTDEPGIQFYAGNFLDGTIKGKRGVAYPRRSGVCLETQHFPDSPNKPQWPSVVVMPGEQYTSNCIYRFSTED